jgi:hypothetical protein
MTIAPRHAPAIRGTRELILPLRGPCGCAGDGAVAGQHGQSELPAPETTEAPVRQQVENVLAAPDPGIGFGTQEDPPNRRVPLICTPPGATVSGGCTARSRSRGVPSPS